MSEVNIVYKEGRPVGWYTRDFIESIEKFSNKIEKYMLYYWKPTHTIIQDGRNSKKRDLKFCYIFIGNTRKMAMIDKNTNIMYKLDGYQETYMQWKHYTLERMCRPMDL